MHYSDPKRPKNIKFFNRENATDENADFFQIISMMFGVASFMLKVKKQIKYAFTYYLSYFS
jgi:hypothetical protein